MRSNRILLAGLLVLFPSAAVCQDDISPPSSRTTYWLGGGYGRGAAEGLLRTEEALSLNLSAQRGSLLLSSRLAAVSASVGETSWDIGLLGGVASSPAHPVHGGVALGLGYAESRPGRGLVTVPAELQLSWRFSRHVGIGAYVFGSLSRDSFYGATLALQAGRLR